jgi:hypothetical protein
MYTYGELLTTYCNSSRQILQVTAVPWGTACAYVHRICSTMCTSPHYHHAVQISVVKAQILRDPVVPRRRGGVQNYKAKQA